MLSHDKTVSITATPEATAMLRRLVLTHGPLALFQSGGCCDGSLPLCLLADDLAPGPSDVLLGELRGFRFTSTRSSSAGGATPRSCLTWPAALRRASPSAWPTRTS